MEVEKVCGFCEKTLTTKRKNGRFCCKACRVNYWNKFESAGYSKIRHKNNPEKVMLRSARNRAKSKGLDFDLTLDDIVIPEVCPVLGVPLVCNAGSGHARQDSPSLDRIIPELGYVKGNIQIISNLANVMKHDASPEQLVNFAKWVLKTYSMEETQ